MTPNNMAPQEAIEHIKLILVRDRNNELHFVSHDEEIALDLAIKVLEEYESLLAAGFIFKKIDLINTKLSDLQSMLLLQNSRVLFLCDKEKCKEIPGFKGCNKCKHTNCIEHAKNFKEAITGLYVEQEANDGNG